MPFSLSGAMPKALRSSTPILQGWIDNGNPTSSPYYSSCFVLGCTSFNSTYGLLWLFWFLCGN